MRDELAKRDGLRRRFQGCFVRFGTKSGYKGPPVKTILLKDIAEIASDKIVTDHLWFTMGKQFQRLNLKPGDVVRFNARVTEYVKGYQGRCDDDDAFSVKPCERDFRLSNPTDIVKIPQNPSLKELGEPSIKLKE